MSHDELTNDWFYLIFKLLFLLKINSLLSIIINIIFNFILIILKNYHFVHLIFRKHLVTKWFLNVFYKKYEYEYFFCLSLELELISLIITVRL